MSEVRLKNKVALVTGAGRGLGAGVAQALAQAGAHVVATDIDERELSKTLRELEDAGCSAEISLLDVTDMPAFSELVAQTITKHQRLDIFVHGAAVLPGRAFADTTLEQWQREFDINVGGWLNGIHLVWDQMKAQGGGHLIAVASGASIRGFWDEAVYCASKHALEGFAKSLAFEGSPFNIAVNTIGPGKLIKPTGISREQLLGLPESTTSSWVDAVELGAAFVWLAMQPAHAVSGLRLDAGPIVDTIAREGIDFDFSPEKVTLYVADMQARLAWQRKHQGPF